MIKKRSKFWTIAFAMLPGAGHMFNGFMKKGVSIMGVFFVLWFAASWLNIGPLTLLTPVVWFYAFFDCINLRFQEDEDFYMQEDAYLFHFEDVKTIDFQNSRIRSTLGIGFVIVGAYALWNNVVMHFVSGYHLLPEAVIRVVKEINYIIPQFIIGVLIILVGVALVQGKKEEIQDDKAKTEEERAIEQ